MEKSRKAPKIVCCDVCGHEWPYNETNLTETRWKDDKNEFFILLSFSCPECGKRYIVSVDDDFTLSDKDDLKKIQVSIRKALYGAKGSDYRALVKEKDYLVERMAKHQKFAKEAYLASEAKGVLVEVK